MKRFWSVFCVLIISSGLAFSQDNAINDLRLLQKSIKQSRPDTSRIKLLLKAGDYYLNKKGWFKVDKDTALTFLNQALALSRILHTVKWENEALQCIGYSYLHVDDVENGSRFFMKVIQYYRSRHDKDLEAKTWERFGDAFNRGPNTLEKKIECYREAQKIYGLNNEPVMSFLAYKKTADMHMIQGRYDMAEKELKIIVKGLKSIGYKNLHFTFDLLASLSKLKGNFHQELFYKKEAVNSMESTGDFSYASYLYYNLAMTYFDLGLYSKSLQYLYKALPFSIAEKNYNRYYEVLTNIVKAQVQEGNINKALDFLIKSTRKIPPANDTQRQWMDAAFGICYEKLGQIRDAEMYYKDLARLSDIDLKNQDIEDYLRNYNTISNFYVARGRYKKAEYYLGKLLNVSPQLIRPSVMSQVELLQFKVDSSSGKLASAIKHYQHHKKLNDSLYNATNKKLFEEVEIRNESEKKDRNLELQSKNIQLLQKQSLLEQNQMDRTKAIKNVFFGGFFLVSVLLALGYNRYRLKQRNNIQLQEKQHIISEKNEALVKLLRDNEWLTREAHHRVKNNMQTIVSLLSSQSLYLKDEAAYEAVADSRHRIQTMSLIHQKLYRSDNMSSIGMRGYITELVDYLSESFKTKQIVHFKMTIDPIDLDVVQAVPVGLILNEAITNSFKHAFPYSDNDCLTISLTQGCADDLLLTISDNGKGLPEQFDGDNVESFGLKLMKGLTEELNGTFSIVNHEGTTLAIVFKKISLHLISVEEIEVLKKQINADS
ncbi:tetratricopeptide repeat-containing sensor histidine kinase [Mucilaginibacter phyllosphaerae]